MALISAMTMFTHAAQAAAPTWPDDVYRAALAESVTDPVLINALRVEPELGTPGPRRPAQDRRRAAGPDDDAGWSVTGRKIFSTGAEGLRFMAVWARTEDAEPRAGSFLVRNDAPGITIERSWDHLGLRASRSDDVTFDATPAVAAILDARPDSSLMAWNSLGLSSLYLGVAAAARDWLIKFLSERSPASLGAPLATLPRFQPPSARSSRPSARPPTWSTRSPGASTTATRPRSPAPPPSSWSRPGPPSARSSRPWR